MSDNCKCWLSWALLLQHLDQVHQFQGLVTPNSWAISAAAGMSSLPAGRMSWKKPGKQSRISTIQAMHFCGNSFLLLKGESIKDEVALHCLQLLGLVQQLNSQGRMGYFSFILNMGSGCKHSFLFPFGNMGFTEIYYMETRLQP